MRQGSTLIGKWGLKLVRAVVLVLCAAGLGCRSEAPLPQNSEVRVAGGVLGGVATLADALVKVYLRKLSDVVFSTRESPGAVTNVDYVESGLAEVTLTQSDIAYIAFTKGTETRPYPHRKLRGMAVLNITAMHLIVAPGIDFHSLKNLRGKRIGIGTPGSSTEVTVRIVLRQFGISLSELYLQWLPFPQMPAHLADRTLDAEFLLVSFPSVLAQAALAVAGTRLVPIQGPALTKLREEYPFLRPIVIPAGTYGQSNDIQTLGVDTVFVCREDLSEDIVYRMLNVFFDSVPELAQVQPALRTISLDQAPGTPIPLHPGAARFYRERELFR